jgi:ferredoxin--NADP+ reductase
VLDQSTHSLTGAPEAPVAEVPAAPPARRASGGLFRERAIEVTHYTEKLFSFKTTRPSSFRFRSGEFVMIGLEVEGKPLLRAYSITSATYDDHLEFFSIKVPNGPLTSRLMSIAVGDELIIGAKPTGTLLVDNLLPGKRLILLATGTGFAPFASIIRDPDTYERFDQVIAVEGCRQIAELEFATRAVLGVREHELLADIVGDRLRYYATVTREPFYHQGRIPGLITSGKMLADMGLGPLDREGDRVMLCGSPGMLRDVTAILHERGFVEGSSGVPGAYVIEKAFVER